MGTNVSQENVDVYTETPHRNMDEENFVNDIKKKIGSDYKPQTMLSGIEWKDKVVIEFGHKCLFFSSLLLVLLDHRAVILRGGFTFHSFWSQNWEEFYKVFV